MSIIDPTLTEGDGRYLNKADFPSQTGLFGMYLDQKVYGGTGTSDVLAPKLLTDDTSIGLDFLINQGGNTPFDRTFLTDDHVGNYNRCGFFKESSGTNFWFPSQNFQGLFNETGNQTYFGKWSMAFWVRMRNNATSNTARGSIIPWGSTSVNGAGGDARFWSARNDGQRLRYNNTNGTLDWSTSFSTQASIGTLPAVSDYIHIAIVHTGTTAASDTVTFYINGVEGNSLTTTEFGGTYGDIRMGPGSFDNSGTLTFDFSELWFTSEASPGFGGTVWDSAQIKKMYEIGEGLFRIPDFSTRIKSNSTTYGTFTWEAPVGVTSITFTGAASGGGGGTSPTANNVSTNNAAGGGGGGGGAAFLYEETITVIPGQTYTFVVADGAAVGNDGSDLTISGQINGSSTVTVTINGGKLGSAGGLGTNAASGGSAGAGGAGATTGGEITTSGAAGGGGGASQNSLPVSSPGSAGGDTTVDGVTISGGSAGAGGSPRRRGGGGGGGASILGGGNGGNGSNVAGAGAGGGGGGGAGFLVAAAGGTGSAGAGGAGGFTFNYLLPKDETDNALVGP